MTGTLRDRRRRVDWTSLTPEQRAMCEQWTRLALKIACRFARRDGVDKGEYFGVAFEYLARAAIAYRPGRGFKFSTYMHSGVTRGILRHRSIHRSIIVSPADRKGGKAGRKATVYVADTERAANVLSLDYRADDGRRTIEAEIVDAPAAEDIVMLLGAVDGLDETDRWVLRARAEGKTYRQIAASLGVSRQRCQQIEAEAIALARIAARVRGVEAVA